MTAAIQQSAPRERPILFQAEMVRAILAGTKTQTRRVVSRPVNDHPAYYQLQHFRTDLGYPASRGFLWAGFGNPTDPCYFKCPYGTAGDRLWVKETWRVSSSGRHYPTRKSTVHVEWREQACQRGGERGSQQCSEWTCSDDESDALMQKAHGRGRPNVWRPSIFMPRWASRIDLEITEVRVQRLQDISEEDAKAEGAFFTDYGAHCFHAWMGPGPCPAPQHHQQRAGWSLVPTTSSDECLLSPRMAFANLWNSTNGSNTWACNPWVWAISFRRVRP